MIRRLALGLLVVFAVGCIARPAGPPPAGDPGAASPQPTAEQAAPTSAAVRPVPGCTGAAVRDLELLDDRLKLGQPDALSECLGCSARGAAGRPAYRMAMLAWLRGQRDRLAPLPGYETWLEATRLRFEPPAVFLLPEDWVRSGYRLQSAEPSPDGRYLGVRLMDGSGATRAGWWELGAGAHGLAPGDGYDLAWHPTEPKLAYLAHDPATGRHLLHMVLLGPIPEHRTVMLPAEGNVRYPAWIPRQGGKHGSRVQPEELLILANPEREPEEIAYLPEEGRFVDRTGAVQPVLAPEPHIPAWITQPWNRAEGLPAWVAGLEANALAYPNPGGSPYYLGSIPPGALRYGLAWSPRGTAVGLAAWLPGGARVWILRPNWDARGDEPVYPFSGDQIAVYDDGNTVFSTGAGADGLNTVVATNHLTGETTQWRLDGPVRQLALTPGALFVVQQDRVHLIRIQEAG